jgi:hypothetical protein
LEIIQKHSELSRLLPRPSKNTKTNKITKKTKRRKHRNTGIDTKKRGQVEGPIGIGFMKLKSLG